MDSSVHRYDFAPITGSETTEEGYLRVWCRAARVGTQLYRRADGAQVREYRPPEEVSKPESLSTFGMKPATWGHPPVLLDADNTKRFQVGYSGSQVRFNDGFVEVALVVTDRDAIERIKRKDATEVSAGYKVDFDPTPGVTPEGEQYDGVQRNIRVNHIAIVPRGRAGPEVRLLMDRMDAADAVACDPALTLQPSPPASPVMATVKLDGMEIDLPAEAASAVQSYARDMERQLKALTSENEKLSERADSLQEQVETLAYDKETAQGTIEGLEDRLKEAEGARVDADELNQLVHERMSVIRHLTPCFAEDFHMDSLSNEDLYIEAFKNITGQDPGEEPDMGYIRGTVDWELSRADASPEDEDEEEDEEEYDDEEDLDSEANLDSADRGDSSEQLETALRGVGRRSNPVATYRQRLEESWKAPLTANANS